MLRKIIYLGIVSTVFLVTCSKEPWKGYTIPEDLRDKQERTDTTLIKVVSVGIFHDNAVLSDVADIITDLDPDFVLVREVDHDNTRSGKGVMQGEIIAEGANLEHYFGGSQVYNTGLYGLSLLSKYPIIEESKVQYGGNRPVATITAQYPDGKTFSFVGAQFEDRNNLPTYMTTRIEHASLLLNYTKAIQNPAILAAGFYIDNTFADPVLEVLAQQYETGCYSCDYTYPKEDPVSIQDIIFYKTSTRYDVIPVKYELIDSPTRGLLVYAEFKVAQ